MTYNSSEKQILQLISFGQGLSRKKIAEQLQLTQGSITNMTKLLLDQKMIIEGERIGQGLGRKEVLLYANPERFRYLGIDIGGYYIRLAIGDHRLNLQFEHNYLMEDLLPIEDRPAALLKLIDQFLLQCDLRPEEIDAAGIGITGIVDANNQTVLNMPNAAYWDNVPLVSIVSKHLGCPTYLDESGRTMALAEQLIGKANQSSDFITVQVGYGIAAGIMINGRLLRGVNNAAGLLGHITADPQGTPCTCGNYGCLENIITFPMLCREYESQEGQGNLTEAYRENNKIALNVCINAGHSLGIALSNVVNLFNPDTIYIGGAMFSEMPLILDETKRTITLRANRFSTIHLQIEENSFGPKQGIMGALALAMHRFVQSL